MSTARGVVIIDAEDRATAVMNKFGKSVGGVQGKMEGLLSKSNAITGLLSGFGLGAIVGIGSIEQIAGSVIKFAQANKAYEQAQRRATLQIELAGLSTGLLSSQVKTLTNILGVEAVTAILNSEEAIKQFSETNNDLVISAATGAEILNKKYGVDIPEAFKTLLEAGKGNFEPLNKLLGISIDSAEELDEVLDTTGINMDSFAKKTGQILGEFFSTPFPLFIEKQFGKMFGEGTPLRRIWDDFVEGLSEAWAGFSENLGGGILNIGKTILAMQNPIGALMSGATGLIEKVFGQKGVWALRILGILKMLNPAGVVIFAFKKMMDFMSGRWEGLFDDVFGSEGFLRTGVRDGLDWIKGAWNTHLSDVFGFTGLLQKWINTGLNLLRGLWGGAITFVSGAWAKVGDTFDSIIERITGLFGSGASFRTRWDDAIGWVTGRIWRVFDTFENVFERVVDFFFESGGLLRRSWRDLIDWFEEKWEDFIEDIFDFDFPNPFTNNATPQGQNNLQGGGRVQVLIDGQIIKDMAINAVTNMFIDSGLGPGAFRT